MRVEKRDGVQDRRILTAMIVDRAALGAISAKWQAPGLFPSRWANLIGQWCVDHYRKYRKAPGRQIEGLFDTWSSAASRDKETVKLVEGFLGTLSGEYAALRKASQTDYAVDAAAEHFTRVRLRQMAEEVQALVEEGQVKRAEELVTKFHRVDMGVGSLIDVLNDKEAVRRAFEYKSEVLVKYPGAAGAFFGDSLARDNFVAFEGPEKRGKTWWLIDLAWRAMLQGRKVAFFEVGDLSESQIMMRLVTRAVRRPLDTEEFEYPTAVDPLGGEKELSLTIEAKRYDKEVSWQRGWKVFQAIATQKLKSKAPLLKLSVHPARSLSVLGMQSILQDQEREGWVPDVVVVDYADILAPVNGTAETRDQINTTWILMRALAVQLHCLVVTASQTNAASYSQDTLDMTNFSEDKRKRAHTTGTVGINQTETEMRKGVYRLNWLARRERKFDRQVCCHCAGSLALANPVMFSQMSSGASSAPARPKRKGLSRDKPV